MPEDTVPRRNKESRCLMEHIKRRVGAADLALIAAAVLAALILLFPRPVSQGKGYAVIDADGELTRLSLGRESKMDLVSNGIALTVVVSEGEICVESADCPDKLCVATGKISAPGRSIVCVPARFSVRIVSGEGEDEDYIVG